jgi:glycosyltransferase involved in cell wall biosynthesis
MSALVSVIMPAFKSSYIREALSSAFSQTVVPFEVIVIDGSPESTLPQIEEYRNRIRYLYQCPKGVSAARNAGIRAAKGDYVAFLDADDIWMNDKLEKQLRAFGAYPGAVICVSTVWNLMDSGRGARDSGPYYPRPLIKWLNGRNNAAEAVFGPIYKLLLAVNCVATSSVVVRKDAISEIGGFDETLVRGEDYDFWLRLARQYPTIFIRNPVSRYRVHDSGLSGSWSKRSRIFYESNLTVLRKHLTAYGGLSVKKSLSRTYVQFAQFELKAAHYHEARNLAFRSFKQWPNLVALKAFVEATCPRFYGLATGFVRR